MLFPSHDLKEQVRFPLVINGITVTHYIADFVFTDKSFIGDGKQHVVDVKGVLTDIFKLKKKMFEAQYGMPIDIVR